MNECYVAKAQMVLWGCLCFVVLAQGQIANIEARRIPSDTVGWEGHADLGGSLSRNNGQRFVRFNAATHLQQKTAKGLWLILGQYDLVQAGGADFVNTGFGHLRYNRKINPHIRWEVFAQVQYNELLKQRIRWLSGTGPRFKLAKTDKLHLYLGTLYMFEFEREAVVPEIIHRDHRFSGYLSWIWHPAKSLRLSGTGYYQPLLRDFRDWRLSASVHFESEVTRQFSIQANFSIVNDTRPPAGVAALAYSLTSGVSWKLR